jgi:hypothetical protein
MEMLLKNHNRNVALLAKQGSRWVHIVCITAHRLEARKLTEEELSADWRPMPEYSEAEGVARFADIARTTGATQQAEQLIATAKEGSPCAPTNIDAISVRNTK